MTPPLSLAHTIWLESAATAFVYLPKVACTSWKLFFAQALHGALPADLAYSVVHDPAALQLPLLGSMEADRQQQCLRRIDAGEVALVAMLREPRQRVLSAYLDKIVHPPNPQSYFALVVRPAIQQQHGLPAAAIPSFLQFLQWLAAGTHPGCRNDHWQPMSQLLGLEHQPPSCYQHLWRMDQIPAAAAELNHRLGRAIPFPGFEALGPRRSSGSAIHLAEAFADPAVVSLFDQLYARDQEIYAALA
jgi:chondroitin 4-sulfotransferase 11/chondroitin 4-sulfotransferase 13/dermatan 4-sulfotransferase 1